MGTRHVMVRGTTLQMSAGGASTIDYSACTAPATASSRRHHSHQNRHTIAFVGSTERLDMGGSGDQGMITLQQVNNRRDDGYYERKYRKSKRRMKKLISDHETEKSRLLEVNNSTLLNHYQAEKFNNGKAHTSYFRNQHRHRQLATMFS